MFSMWGRTIFPGDAHAPSGSTWLEPARTGTPCRCVACGASFPFREDPSGRRRPCRQSVCFEHIELKTTRSHAWVYSAADGDFDQYVIVCGACSATVEIKVSGELSALGALAALACGLSCPGCSEPPPAKNAASS